MAVAIDPEPSKSEREAIIAALAGGTRNTLSEWERAALDEGVEEAGLDP